MNTTVLVSDERQIEVLAAGLPTHHGAQLAVDITHRSAVTACGGACAGAATSNGAVSLRARRNKYFELLQGGRCHLVVVPIESGGRWGEEAVKFIPSLASAGSREAPAPLQRSAFRAWRRRWTRMLAFSCCRAFAGSLVSSGDALEGADVATPDLADLFGEVV